MTRYCCVPGCKQRTGGHLFPKDKNLKLKWRIAIKRADPKTGNIWNPGPTAVVILVCKNHFRDTDYQSSLLGERTRLRKCAIPSVFTFCKEKGNITSRTVRAELRSHIPDFQHEVEVETAEEGGEGEASDTEADSSDQGTSEAAAQCEILSSSTLKFRLLNFITNVPAIRYYTGFSDYDHFMYLFHVLGAAASDLNYKCQQLSPVDQLFLTVIKLRTGKDDVELSILFDVSQSVVSKVINTWINFLYFQLKEINIWPSREAVETSFPESFAQKFPSTRVILDATETPIQKPSHAQAQSMTYSTYKNRNTIKTMIGCTPRGLVSYISDAYSGSTSDRQIVERSELLDRGKFSSGDSIMADRGIMVQDLFASRGVLVNTPTMLKGKSQLEPEEVVRDRRIASKRIHVERVIGLAKTYKILKKELPLSKVSIGSRIVFVCFMLSNFRKSIVNRLS